MGGKGDASKMTGQHPDIEHDTGHHPGRPSEGRRPSFGSMDKPGFHPDPFTFPL